MRDNLEQQMIKAMEWLKEQAKQIDYGTVTLTVIRHGKTWRLEKGVTEKIMVKE